MAALSVLDLMMKEFTPMSLDINADSPLKQRGFDASMRAIAHSVRRNILEWLKEPHLYFPDQEYGQELGVCVGQITLRCGLAQSTVSGHLALLKEAGLVNLKKSGSVHFLTRNEAAIRNFSAILKIHI